MSSKSWKLGASIEVRIFYHDDRACNNLENKIILFYRLNDLATTYLTMLVGFSTGLVVFISEIIMRFFNKRKARLVREDGNDRARRIQVQPKKARPTKPAYVGYQQPGPSSKKTLSPPPEYNEAIRTISSLKSGSSSPGPSNIESYRTFNGRTYAVVKTDGGTQLVILFLIILRLLILGKSNKNLGAYASSFSCNFQLPVCLQLKKMIF
jgi:hypothetical protein